MVSNPGFLPPPPPPSVSPNKISSPFGVQMPDSNAWVVLCYKKSASEARVTNLFFFFFSLFDLVFFLFSPLRSPVPGYYKICPLVKLVLIMRFTLRHSSRKRRIDRKHPTKTYVISTSFTFCINLSDMYFYKISVSDV